MLGSITLEIILRLLFIFFNLLWSTLNVIDVTCSLKVLGVELTCETERGPGAALAF